MLTRASLQKLVFIISYLIFFLICILFHSDDLDFNDSWYIKERSMQITQMQKLLLNRCSHHAILSLVKFISLVRKCWMVFSMHLLVPSCCRVVDRQSTSFCLLLPIVFFFSFFCYFLSSKLIFWISCLTMFCNF